MGLRLSTAVALVSIAAFASVPLVLADPSKGPETKPSVPAADKVKDAKPAEDQPAKSDGLEEVKYEAAPRAKQIEPILVAPVKREAPKTPDIKEDAVASEKPKQQVVTIEKDPTLERRATGAKPAIKSCGAGTKRSRDGTRCERIASVAKKSGKRR